MTLIKNWNSWSMQCYNMLTPCNMSPTAMTQGIGTDRHLWLRTSWWMLLSLSEAGPSTIWIPPTSWVMWCAQIRGLRFRIMGFVTTLRMSVLLSLKGLKVGPNMKIGDTDRRRSIDIPKWPWGTTGPPLVVPIGPRSRTSEGLRQQNREVGLIVNPGEGGV